MDISQVIDQKNQLVDLWWSGLQAVNGESVCTSFAKTLPTHRPYKVAAVGKAAADMMRGLQSAEGCLDIRAGLIISKEGLGVPAAADFPNCQLLTASHPLPQEDSLVAGRALYEFVESCSADEDFVMLLSGGASALAVMPIAGMQLATIQQKNTMLLKSGASIDEINHYRRTVSMIKGGKLHEHFSGDQWTTGLISDVRGDDIYTIGSGLGAPQLDKPIPETFSHHLLGTNAIAREAIELAAQRRGLMVVENSESMYDDVHRLANVIASKIKSAAPGVLIMGGEPTIRLPEKPGKGGRNHSLALALAIAISGEPNVAIMVAGTDGDDGVSAAAGGIIDGQTISNLNHAHRALKNADAATYLAKQGAQFVSGPTGTNVMDILIAHKW